MPGKSKKLNGLKNELRRLESRRYKLIAEIVRIEAASDDFSEKHPYSCHESENGVNNQSPPEAKVKLFLSLFHGRQDVYPRRFESRRTGKSGYQPACKNEWVYVHV